MREIKFRIWDSENMESPKMQYCDSLLVCDNGLFFEISNFEGYKHHNDTSNPHIMQFTGLKNKNGVDIYEGDILGGYPHGTVIVKWDHDYACFSCYDIKDGTDCGLLANELDNCKDAWEVVGNIYENPELLLHEQLKQQIK